MKPIGYQFLIETFKLEVLQPTRTSFVRPRGSDRIFRIIENREEEIYPPRYDPGEGWQAHLGFALKHEGLNLGVLEALYQRLPQAEMSAWILSAPHSRYVRIAWFVHEWLSGTRLPVPDLIQGNYVPVLEEGKYYTLPGKGVGSKIRRQRILNNLLGTPGYCPMVRRTAVLQSFEESRLDKQARAEMRRFPEGLLHRAAQYLYVKETKSSYAIERLSADQRRTARFVALLEKPVSWNVIPKPSCSASKMP